MEQPLNTRRFCLLVLVAFLCVVWGSEIESELGPVVHAFDSGEIEAEIGHKYEGTVSKDNVSIFVYNKVPVKRYENVRMEISMEKQEPDPVFVVVRTKQTISSVQLPMRIGKKSYYKTTRTLCFDPDTPDSLSTFYVDVTTLSDTPLKFSLMATIFNSSQLLENQTISVEVNPSQPQVLSYNIADMEKDEVLVKFESEDSHCSIVSIQDAVCPVYDQADDVVYQGTYQTFTKKAGIVVHRHKLTSSWFFIVVIALPSNNSCIEMYSLIPTVTQSSLPAEPTHNHLLYSKTAPPVYSGLNKRVKIIIEDVNKQGEIGKAIVIAVLAIMGFYGMFLIYATYDYCRLRSIRKYLLHRNPSEGDPEECQSNDVTACDQVCRPSTSAVACTVQDNPRTVTFRESVPSSHKEGAEYLAPEAARVQKDGDNARRRNEQQNLAPTKSRRSYSSSPDDDVDKMGDLLERKEVRRMKPEVCVHDLSQKKPTKLRRKYNMYVWTIITIAVFYTLPVFHLMIAYQSVFSSSGNQDLCYYNFWCAKPYSVFTSFNNVFSNVGYVLLGVLYFLIVYTKNVNYKLKLEIDPGLRNRGIPKHFGLFYAIAFALVMEGVMSACYHVCPNWFNFQFDVSFMYMIAGLGMLRMYQSRHPDVNAKSHWAFLWFAFVIATSVLGVIFHSSNWFWIAFVIGYLATVLYVTCQVYFLGTVKLDSGVFKRTWNILRSEYFILPFSFRNYLPLKPDRFILLVVANLCNWAFAILGSLKRPSNFGTFLLAIFISNLMLYFLFYVIMKLRVKERVSYMSYILGFINLCTWGFALFFFKDASSNWQLSPAQSRELNRDCLVLDFFDFHDIWHFLSAVSLFVSFLIVLNLDDDLDDVSRSKIKVF